MDECLDNVSFVLLLFGLQINFLQDCYGFFGIISFLSKNSQMASYSALHSCRYPITNFNIFSRPNTGVLIQYAIAQGHIVNVEECNFQKTSA